MTLLLAPFAPHLAEELWARAGRDVGAPAGVAGGRPRGAGRDEVVIAVQVAASCAAR
jgi:leucyl-tRNA synthetase